MKEKREIIHSWKDFVSTIEEKLQTEVAVEDHHTHNCNQDHKELIEKTLATQGDWIRIHI